MTLHYDKEKQPYILTEVVISGQTYKALVDTGATKTILHKSLIKDFHVLQKDLEKISVVTAHGKTLKHYTHTVNIRHGYKNYSTSTVVFMNLIHVKQNMKKMGIPPVDLLLGLPDILKLGLIDF